MRNTAAAIPVLLLLVAGGVACAADKFTVGDWDGEARFADDGHFSRCTIEGQYQSGIVVNFGVTRDYAVEIWVDNPAWNLTKDNTYPVQYWIDGNAHQRGTLTAIDRSFGRINVDNGVVVFDQLRNGTQLIVSGIAKNETFRLDNTNAALTRMRQCVDSEMQAELERSIAAPNGQNNPASRSGDPGGRAGNPKGPADTAPDLIAALFKASPRLSGFRIVTGDDVPKDMRNEEIVWKAPGGMGSANRYVDKPPKQIMREIVESDRKSCAKGFNSSDSNASLPDGSPVQRFATACADGNWFVQYSAYEGRNGAWFVIGNFSLGKADGARQADDAIFAAISDTVRR
jgi:hypothetical protein